jgi:hypothetical protein
VNIFFLDPDPTTCAEYHFDKHMSKMVIEYAQLLSTAHNVLDDLSSFTTPFYKTTHVNHPSAVWVRESIHHYTWLYRLFRELSLEYRFRYGRDHATWVKLGEALKRPPQFIPKSVLWFDPPPCMPAKFVVPGDIVASYRNYYLRGKPAAWRKWKGRTTPFWTRLEQFA